MTSLKQIEANRRNALKSTGPTTPEGKERSRCNAVRHGLTAETVVAALEDAKAYLPRSVPEADLAIMRRLDRLHLELPFAGSRMLRGLLAAEGCKIGRRHVKT